MEITGERSFFILEETTAGVDGKHNVFIALGCNIGDPFRVIEDDVAEVEKRVGCLLLFYYLKS